MAAIIDQHGSEGKALQKAVQIKLRSYLGADYNDEVLPLYIVVMLAHQTQEEVIAENLEAFLSDNAAPFTSWLFHHLGTLSKSKSLRLEDNKRLEDDKMLEGTSAIAAEVEPLAVETAAPATVKDINASRDRRDNHVSLRGDSDSSDNMSDSSDRPSLRETGPVADSRQEGEETLRQCRRHDRGQPQPQPPSSEAHRSDRQRHTEAERPRQLSSERHDGDHHGRHHRRHERGAARGEEQQQVYQVWGHHHHHSGWEGRPREGHSREGHSKEGHHYREGRPREGHSREGYSREGYSREGHHSREGRRGQHASWQRHPRYDPYADVSASWHTSHVASDRYLTDEAWHSGEAVQRYRSLSPLRQHHSWSSRGDAVNKSLEHPSRRPPPAHRHYWVGNQGDRRGRAEEWEKGRYRGGSIPGGVPPEIDFEAKAQDGPQRYRQRTTPYVGAYEQFLEQTQGAERRTTGSAPEGVDIDRHRADSLPPPPHQTVRLSDRLSLPDVNAHRADSLPSPLQTDRQLDGRNPAVRLSDRLSLPEAETPQHQVLTQPTPGSLARVHKTDGGASLGVSPSEAVTPSRQLPPVTVAGGHVAGLSSRASAAIWAPGVNGGVGETGRRGEKGGGGVVSMEGIQEQLHSMATVLEQLRAAARLEAVASEASRVSVFSRISFPSQWQPPRVAPLVNSHLRSVTVTAVHPLALQHPTILRAHFGTTGHILRTTVLRNQETGAASGKAHVEYDSVLAARTALQLSHSLLLDRPVYVRMKNH